MSTKASIILTTDHEHWYEDTSSETNGAFDIEISIDIENIKDSSFDYEGLFVTIKGDSNLARYIRKMRGLKNDR